MTEKSPFRRATQPAVAQRLIIRPNPESPAPPRESGRAIEDPLNVSIRVGYFTDSMIWISRFSSPLTISLRGIPFSAALSAR